MVRQHSMELQARYLGQVGCRSLVHDGQRRAIGPAQALDHAVDARDVVVCWSTQTGTGTPPGPASGHGHLHERGFCLIRVSYAQGIQDRQHQCSSLDLL